MFMLSRVAPRTQGKDEYMWIPDYSRALTVKSCYKLLTGEILDMAIQYGVKVGLHGVWCSRFNLKLRCFGGGY